MALVDSEPSKTPRLLQSWSKGLTTNLLNPKIGAFYLAVLPQFIPVHAPHLAVGLMLACVHNVEGLVWFAGIICAAHTVRGMLARRKARRTVDGVTGVTLIGFGLRLALTAR